MVDGTGLVFGASPPAPLGGRRALVSSAHLHNSNSANQPLNEIFITAPLPSTSTASQAIERPGAPPRSPRPSLAPAPTRAIPTSTQTRPRSVTNGLVRAVLNAARGVLRDMIFLSAYAVRRLTSSAGHIPIQPVRLAAAKSGSDPSAPASARAGLHSSQHPLYAPPENSANQRPFQVSSPASNLALP